MTESRAKSTASAVPHPYWIDGINDPKDTSRLVKRVKLSDLMNYDPRASYRHRRLWDFHLGWAHKDYNWTSLASVRRIHAEMQARSPTGTALSIQNIASGDRDLVEWKYLFEEEKGSGRRGSRFSINWQLLELAANGHFPVSVHPVGDAISVHPVDDTSVHPVGDANPVSVHPVDDKDPTTKTRLTDGATSSSNGSDGAATPPASAGPVGAVPPESPPGGFEEFWNAYAHKQQRAKAKAAWAKLDPSAELASTIITEAGRWATHYAEHAVEPRWRVLPHNWLAGENWLQDLPIIHTDPKSAGIANVRGSARPRQNSDKAAQGKIATCIVTDYAEEGSPFADWYVTLDFQPEEPEDGRPFSRKFHVLTTGGDGPDLDAYNDAVRAVFGKGKPIAEWVGRYVGVDKSGYWHLPDYQPEPEPASPPRRLTIEEAEREAYESFCAENGI
ncbi:hypothetical protein [Bradyrhizobium japonicum]|uniref:hypothetical protein n=1 Tax=Bradyrhizobium japonicum TaxID=375 RepID=UPI000456D9DB|nr:hypothetical protein [Bradyrhizobium japonicum]AHY50705.1 hypothetical protein BJS_03551 [Bradyrhizobium japonicum SEMIA 5079]MCD9104539.1 hypothetical protein [Bradyrhizobium japonicum]MCD9258473.1 hypothetical protein [Bradyrhizobium japonicum SEMIA 5079]MCD9819852.1 hypothetical protein [Bradyrhizobium japonicum]MCD9895377.1 hypothetical protein [Bradyrhizobium japonicum]